MNPEIAYCGFSILKVPPFSQKRAAFLFIVIRYETKNVRLFLNRRRSFHLGLSVVEVTSIMRTAFPADCLERDCY